MGAAGLRVLRAAVSPKANKVEGERAYDSSRKEDEAAGMTGNQMRI